MKRLTPEQKIVGTSIDDARSTIKQASLDTLKKALRIATDRQLSHQRVTLVKLLEAEIKKRKKRGEA